jgi:hypothetical protein
MIADAAAKRGEHALFFGAAMKSRSQCQEARHDKTRFVIVTQQGANDDMQNPEKKS